MHFNVADALLGDVRRDATLQQLTALIGVEEGRGFTVRVQLIGEDEEHAVTNVSLHDNATVGDLKIAVQQQLRHMESDHDDSSLDGSKLWRSRMLYKVSEVGNVTCVSECEDEMPLSTLRIAGGTVLRLERGSHLSTSGSSGDLKRHRTL